MQEADDIPTVVEEDIQMALEDKSATELHIESNYDYDPWDVDADVVDDEDHVEEAIQRALEDESATELYIVWHGHGYPPLTDRDARGIIECLRQTPRVDTLEIGSYSLHDDVVLNVFRDGLPLCTSITTVKLVANNLTNEDLDRLRPAFSNSSITKLHISNNDHIEGQHGGEVLRDLLVGNDTLRELDLTYIHIGPEGAIGIGQGLADNHGLQVLSLFGCSIGNDFLANLLPADDSIINNSLTNLHLGSNNIEGEDGGRQVSLLLQCFPALKVLHLNHNRLGDLGARALAPGLAAASHLEELFLHRCGLGNDGVANLILPDGQVNRSLTTLNLHWNDIEGEEGGRKVTLLLQCFPALKVLYLYHNNLGPLGARALAPGLAAARHLELLALQDCGLGNAGVANLIPDGQVDRSLTSLDISDNGIVGEEGGRQVSLLLQCFPALKVLHLHHNNLGPLGARALAPDLAAAISQLEELDLAWCRIGNDGVANLVPDGQVNRSLTNLIIIDDNIEGLEGGENVVALASRCTNLDRLDVNGNVLSPDQQRRLAMLFDRNHLYLTAQALGGSTFPVLFRFVEKAHCHEHGLSAIFVILQNDGDDYFCTALDRAID